jgi:pimeloyl-ACP methyl ester carboxylesterase
VELPGGSIAVTSLLWLGLSVACAPAPRQPSGPPRAFDQRILVNRHQLTLHMTRGARKAALLVYATGDGGWRGKDREVYTQLESWGYTAVGFSAPEYLRHLPGVDGDDGTTTPERLSQDYAEIIASARHSLQIPDSEPVILVGVSRGADLAVVAAGQPGLQPQLGGVVVMALTKEEEYVRRRRRPTVPIDLYPYLSRLGDLPLVVIQSTRDNYLNAEDARALFGEDTAVRQFHAVEADNHSFGGARPLLYETLRRALDWVEQSVEHDVPR